MLFTFNLYDQKYMKLSVEEFLLPTVPGAALLDIWLRGLVIQKVMRVEISRVDKVKPSQGHPLSPCNAAASSTSPTLRSLRPLPTARLQPTTLRGLGRSFGNRTNPLRATAEGRDGWLDSQLVGPFRFWVDAMMLHLFPSRRKHALWLALASLLLAKTQENSGPTQPPPNPSEILARLIGERKPLMCQSLCRYSDKVTPC